jgi:integrase
MQRAHGRWLCSELGNECPVETIDETLLEHLTGPRVPPRKFGAETLRKRMSTLRGTLVLAHLRRWIDRLPAFPHIIAPVPLNQNFLERYDDARKIFEALPLHRGEWFWLCLWTGQHVSDVSRMAWSDVSLDGERPSMLIRNTKNGRTGGLRVEMPRPLLRVLRAKFDRERPKSKARIVGEWTSRHHTLTLTCYRLGLKPINATQLRHTCFSWAVRKLGITPSVLAWAGHSSAAMMARRYAHVLPPALGEVARELNSMDPDDREGGERAS